VRNRTHRPVGIVAVGLATALALTGCGGGDEPAEDGDTTETTVDTATPEPGGTLTYAVEAESSGGFCLAEAQLSAAGIQVANAIFEPLMAYDENLEPKPYLAESVEANADNTSFTFKLRPGVKFHDDTELTAGVVKENIDLWRGDKAATDKYGRSPLLLPFVFQDIADVQAPDPTTVVVNTKRPWSAFPNFLAGGRYGIMATSQYSDPACAEKLVGTGPFKLVSWQRGQQMELEKNPDYWRKDADGNQLPYLDKVVFKPIEGGQPRFDALDGGSINALHTSSQSVFDALQDDPDRFVFIPEDEGHKEVGYGLVNASKAPLDDIEVRKHMGMAIDRDVLNDINSDGEFEIANGPFDTEVIGYLEDPGTFEYDPDTAKAFFDGKDIEVDLAYATDPTTKLIAESVKTQLDQVGVTVNITEVDQATLINQAIGGTFQIILFRNHPGGDPDTQYVWWHSTSPVNFGRIKDPRIDKALDDGRVESDPAKRKAIYEDLNRAFVDGAWNLWNWYTEWGVGSAKEVHNLTGTTLPDGSKGAGMNWGWHYLTEAWVEQ